MHIHSLYRWEHSHDFSLVHLQGERRTTLVLVITAVTMILEVLAGHLYGSMALLADGWHMGTHVAAFGISVFAYQYARRHAKNPLFTFGTGKVSVLGGFASAVGLAVVALMMAIESMMRFFEHREVHYNESIAIAGLGLSVNLVCAILLQDRHSPHTLTGEDCKTAHDHDHNLRAAYLHVLADALTSVLALVALVCGKYLGWKALDPFMGLAGAAVIMRWSWQLLRQTSVVLLDGAGDEALKEDIKRRIENDADNRITDIHVWKVGPAHFSVALSVVTHDPRPPDHYKKLLSGIERLHHLTVEVNPCESEPCIAIGELGNSRSKV